MFISLANKKKKKDCSLPFVCVLFSQCLKQGLDGALDNPLLVSWYFCAYYSDFLPLETCGGGSNLGHVTTGSMLASLL